VDIRRRVERGHTVSGSVTGGADASVLLLNLADLQPESSSAAHSSGGFEIAGIPDGDYELFAQHRAADGSTAASMPRKVSVRGADISGIELTLAPFGSIAGRVTLEPPPARCAEGAASLGGKVVPASETDKLPKRLRVHLIPAEPAAANEVVRYAEILVAGDGAFEFKHLAPGRYWLLAKSADPVNDRAVAWDATARATLRREAEAAKNEIELKPCSRVDGYVLRVVR